MHLDLEAPNLALDIGQVITLDDAAGVRIHATRGTVWVTEEGDINDHIVGPGDVLTIANCGRTVVQALAPAWISIRTGTHWLSGLLAGAADRMERMVATDASVTSHEMHFDSDAYLAHLKNRIYTQYY